MGPQQRRTILHLLCAVGAGAFGGCLGRPSGEDDSQTAAPYDPLHRWLPADLTLFEHQDFTVTDPSADRDDLASTLGIDPADIHMVTFFGFGVERRSGFVSVGEFDTDRITATIEENQSLFGTGSRREFEIVEIETGTLALDSSTVVFTSEPLLETMFDAYYEEVPRLFEPDSDARAALSTLEVRSHLSYRDVTARADSFPTLSPAGVTEAVQAKYVNGPSRLVAAFESPPSAAIVERIGRERELTHLSTSGRVATFEGSAFDGAREVPAPQVSFSFDGNASTLTITHDGGDSFAARGVTIAGESYQGEDTSWADLSAEASPSVSAGDRITIGTDADCNCPIRDSGGRLRLVYTPEAGNRSVTVATYDVPAA